ncbi:hypothetical protein LCGC14_1534730 [marine sediment metagenome]|uniref:Uncharacterized protein n=1 Tax=marine sediment metagenome TaxID=412755 RepID=A0A0F9LVP8_9ZZZZ
MTRTTYIGIDPGKLTGGIAAIQPWASPNPVAKPCPQTLQDMLDALDSLRENILEVGVVAVIEKVHGFSGQGAGASFKFGENYGAWLMALTALQIPFKEVAPGTWQRRYGKMPKGKTPKKNRLKELAQQRYPQLTITHSTAAALLIATYAKEVAWE